MAANLIQPDCAVATRPLASRAVDAVCLAALLAIVVLRPLIAETYDSGGSSMTRALGQVSDASPLTTLTINTIILLAAVACMGVRAWWGEAYRRTGLELGTLLVIGASIVSCIYAGQKRLAINGASDWVCFPVLTIALVQLLRTEGLRRLTVALVLAGACAQAAQCIEQATVGNAETWQHYLSMKEDFWRAQGVELDAPTVELFERRMQSREAQGFLPHSNVTGAYLMLCAVVGAGAVVERWRRRQTAGDMLRGALGALVIAVLLVATYATGSLGAMVSGAIGVALWTVLAYARPWTAGHRRAALLIGWAVAVAGALVFVGHGLVHDTFPHMSLTFRWQYWKVTAGMIADYFWTGVGRENFGRHYLFYKPMDAPEEISNPHNVFMQAFAEWGVFGLAGVLLMVVGATRMLARPVVERSEAQESGTPTRGWWYAAAVALVLIFIRPALLGVADANYAYYITMTTLIPAGVGFAIFYARVGGAVEPSVMELALPVGLFTMLLHDQISFALFVPGTATTFFALLGCALAGRETAVRPYEFARRGYQLAVGVMIVGIGLVSHYGLYMGLRGARDLAEARRQLDPVTDRYGPTYSGYDASRLNDPYDPTIPLLRAGQLFTVARDIEPSIDSWLWHDLGVSQIRQAIELDPQQPALRRMLARARVEKSDKVADGNRREPFRQRWTALDFLKSAIAAAREALALYPHDPDGLIFLAEIEEKAAVFDDQYRSSAREHYQRALELDGQRAWFESIRKFNDRKKSDIRARIERLQSNPSSQ